MVDVHQTRRVQPVASCASRSGNPKAMVLLLSVLTVFRVQGREHPDDMCRKIPMQCSSSHRLLLDCPEVLGLYRKRPLRGSVDHMGVGGRFRYSDLKEAAGYGI